MTTTDTQLDKLRAYFTASLPPLVNDAGEPLSLSEMRAADPAFPNFADFHDAAELIVPLQRRDAAVVSELLDRLSPSERIGVLHALVFMIHDAQAWAKSPTSEGTLAAAVYLSLNP